MVKNRLVIDVYYDDQKQERKISLNPDKRLIKVFKNIDMDVTVIEKTPKDNIQQEYFLLPLIDYMNNYKKLIGQDIAIIQYPKGELTFSEGKIINLTGLKEFAHGASTDEGASGSPIFLKGTTKVLGIHKLVLMMEI